MKGLTPENIRILTVFRFAVLKQRRAIYYLESEGQGHPPAIIFDLDLASQAAVELLSAF
jgi:hypothetical protein